jgi:hypothetical protein
VSGGDRVALKEWAVVEHALAVGEVSLLLRREGIRERRGGAEVEHPAFWILPTGWHGNPADLAPRLHPLLERLPPRFRDQIAFRVHATVEREYRIDDEARLEALLDLHPLSLAAAHARFHDRDRPLVHALLLRARILPVPVRIPELNRYEGCVTWVELDVPIPTDGLVPVLDDARFGALAADVDARLG